MSVLVIAEHDNQTLRPAVFNILQAATLCGDEIHVLVAGSACNTVAEAVAQIPAAKKVLHCDAPLFAHPLAEDFAAQIVSIVKPYTHVVFASTTEGRNVAPRVAALLDVAQISDVIAVEAADVFQRPIYAGNAIAKVQATDAIKVLTVRTTAFDAIPSLGGNATIEAVAAVSASGLSQYLGEEVQKSERPELTSAKIVVSGGRGVGSKDNFQIIDQLADTLKAAVGASRAAVDAGYAPNDKQVGQTGKVVAPDLYVAVGISGAIQHLAGIKDSKVIVAINKDAEAPIFHIADFGLVADLFQAVPEMLEALK